MKGSGPDPRWVPHVLRSLYPALDGERPLMLFADRASDLEWIAEWVSVNRFRAVVGSGRGLARCGPLGQSRNCSDCGSPLFRGRSFDQLQARPDNAALLVEAGVPVILSSFSTHNARSLRQVAGNAIREGMAPLDAMRALTKTPRTVFEQKTSKHLVIWDGDPLNYPLEPWRCGLMASGFRFPPGRQSFGTAISSALGSRRTSWENFIETGWRKCTGIEPARDTFQCPSSGFEDQASHQTRPISTSEHTLPVDPRQSVELFDCYS